MTENKSNNPLYVCGPGRVVGWMTLALVVLLGIELALRMVFPWDMYFWSESTFLTNLLKLDNGLPLYTAPADGNSFVYSPGLEYLTYALLKPFGLQLDIRFCRLISILLAVAAAGFGALAMRRLAKATRPAASGKVFFFLAWGIAFLAVAKNYLVDVPHPDNLHTLHALAVFWLCFSAVETKRFSLALLTMVLAGVGVFAKQTDAACVLGPAAAFAIFNQWGWRRWLLLVVTGCVVFGVSLWALWLPEHARFYTLDLLSHHGFGWRPARRLMRDFLCADRGFLVLGIAACVWLWKAGGASRRYLICWAVVGGAAVLPSLAAYYKAMGAWNNLIILEVWLVLVVWPGCGILFDAITNSRSGAPACPLNPRFVRPAAWIFVAAFFVFLLPTKLPMPAAGHRYCQVIQEQVTRDFDAGRKVLVAHGTEFLLRAGSREVPRDRANSVLELNVGHVGEMSEMQTRIRAGYYDRIYLVKTNWYGDALLEEINRNYAVKSVVPGVPYLGSLIFGIQDLMEDCQILELRQKVK